MKETQKLIIDKCQKLISLIKRFFKGKVLSIFEKEDAKINLCQFVIDK